MQGVYEPGIFDSDDDTLGGINWGNVIGQVGGAAAQTGLQILAAPKAGSGANCLQSQVSGDEAMTACVPRVMALFDELASQMAFLPPEQIIAGANQIAGIFSDPRYFNQSIGGRSREIREAAKRQARATADAIIASVATAIPAPAGTATGTTAGTLPGTTPAIDTQTLLILGGAAVLLIFLMKS